MEILADLNQGNCLKITDTGLILKCFHGIKELTEEEIKRIYGDSMKIPKDYNFNYESTRSEHYYYFQGYFEYHMSSIFLFCVELYNLGLFYQGEKLCKESNGSLTDSSIDKNCQKAEESYINYKSIMKNMHESLFWNYGISNRKMEETGYFYPEICANPKKYLCENTAKEALIQLKKLGLKTFYATNSYKEFGDFIIKNSLGEDFRSLFDLCVSFTRKPSFFNVISNTEEIYFSLSECQLEPYSNQEQISLNSLLEDELLFEEIRNKKDITTGSFEVVKKFYEKLLNKNNLSYIYVGDSIVNDCIAPVKKGNIKSIVIIEFIDSFYHGIKPDHLAEYWELPLDKYAQQHFIKMAREYADFSISNVQSLKLLC